MLTTLSTYVDFCTGVFSNCRSKLKNILQLGQTMELKPKFLAVLYIRTWKHGKCLCLTQTEPKASLQQRILTAYLTNWEADGKRLCQKIF